MRSSTSSWNSGFQYPMRLVCALKVVPKHASHTLTTAVTAQNGTTVVTYSVVVTRLAGLQSWRLKYFGTTANSGDTADTGDFDHNGIPNLMKYAFGLDPTSPASRSLPQPAFDGNALTITFTEPVGILGVTYGAEWCADVSSGTWSSVPDTGAGTTHIFSVPMSGKATGFLRLKVTGQ